MSGCRWKTRDVDHSGLKIRCEPCVTLSNFDDAPMYGRTRHLPEILRAGRAYGNLKNQAITKLRILRTWQYTVRLRQFLETHQLQYHVLLVIYIHHYILHIQDMRRYLHHIFPSANLPQVHFHSQGSQGADGDSFLGSSLSTQLVKLLTAS